MCTLQLTSLLYSTGYIRLGPVASCMILNQFLTVRTGVRGLYKGLLPDMAKIAPAAAISWTVFERGAHCDTSIALALPRCVESICTRTLKHVRRAVVCCKEPPAPWKTRLQISLSSVVLVCWPCRQVLAGRA